MTCEVIDALRRRWLSSSMRRYDRLLRTVMWLDAFLSVAMVVICLLAVPIVSTLGVPHAMRSALAVGALVCALLLAAFGAITAVALMLRMRGGDYALPHRLRLPLPPPMRPAPILGVRQTASRMHTDVSLST